MEMVSPDTDFVMAYPMVLHGLEVQAPVSLPVGETWRRCRERGASVGDEPRDAERQNADKAEHSGMSHLSPSPRALRPWSGALPSNYLPGEEGGQGTFSRVVDL
jgi:hypothetical protein